MRIWRSTSICYSPWIWTLDSKFVSSWSPVSSNSTASMGMPVITRWWRRSRSWTSEVDIALYRSWVMTWTDEQLPSSRYLGLPDAVLQDMTRSLKSRNLSRSSWNCKMILGITDLETRKSTHMKFRPPQIRHSWRIQNAEFFSLDTLFVEVRVKCDFHFFLSRTSEKESWEETYIPSPLWLVVKMNHHPYVEREWTWPECCAWFELRTLVCQLK